MRHALLLALLAPLPLAARAGTLEVTVDNLRTQAGHIRVALCDPAHFTKEGCPYTADAQAVAPTTVLRLENIPAGTYALQGFQDERDTHQLRRSLLGIPEEGILFSRDPHFSLRPPRFAEAAFPVAAEGVTRIRVRLRYF